MQRVLPGEPALAQETPPLNRRLVALTIGTQIALGLLMLACALLMAPLSRPDLSQDYNNACAWWNAPARASFQAFVSCPPDLVGASAGTTAHPPFATLAVLPLAVLAWPGAYYAWMIISGVAITATWLAFRVPPVACAVSAPLWIYGMARGALEPVIFVLLAVALSLSRRPRLAAALIGVAAAFKVYPALLLAAPLLRRRYGDLVVAAICGATASLLAEVVLGPGTTQTWLQFTPGNMLRWISTPDNVSLVRVVWSILPVSPSLIALALYSGLVGVIALRRGPTLSYQTLLPVMVLASPLAWSHYLGHVTLAPLSRAVALLIGLGSGLLLLSSMEILPISEAALVYTPLLAALLLAWYEQTRPAPAGAL